MASTEDQLNSVLELIVTAGRLKQIPRTGWTRYPIPRPESVADHSFRTAILSLFLAPLFGVDQDKAVRMALLHDLAEAIIGDIVTDRGAADLPNKAQKLAEERKAMKDILSKIGAEEYLSLFDEYVGGETPEARLVHQLDKLEMAAQAQEYELAHNLKLDEFFVSAERKIYDPLLRELLSSLKQRPLGTPSPSARQPGQP